jgi:hypothetical protein
MTLVFIRANGEFNNKTKFIERLDEEDQFVSREIKDIVIERIEANHAIVSCTLIGKLKKNNEVKYYRNIRIFIKQDKAWLLHSWYNYISEIPDQEDYRLTGKDSLELWKYFSNHADQIKERLWTTFIWHFTALSALLGFIAKSFLQLDPSQNTINQPQLFSLFSFVGVLFCVFTILFVKGYGSHINYNWDCAKRSKEKVKRLDSIINWITSQPQINGLNGLESYQAMPNIF